MTIAEATASLTGPGGQFEVTTTDEVDGTPMKVYKERLPNLRFVSEVFGSAHGDKEFVVHGDRRITYGDFLAEVNAVTAWLAAHGIAKGDRVAVLSANNPQWCATFWAAVNMGAILVGLNGWWNTDEITYGLNHSGSRVLVADRARYARLEGHLHEVPLLEHVLLIDPTDLQGAADGEAPGVTVAGYEQAVREGSAGNPGFPDTEISESDPAVIFYTSGTTGRPKGAVSTHGNMVANLQNTIFSLSLSALTNPEASRAGDGSQPVSLLTSPLFHVSGCHSTLVVGFMGGMKLVIPEGRFDPEKVFGLIEREGVKIWATVPTMIWRATEHPARHDHDLSSIVSVAFGGSPSADELQRRIRETFPNVKATTNAYGLTESSSVATILASGSSPEKADSVGTPMPVVDIAVADPVGRHLAPGETGEVLIRGPIVMAGYWDNPEATAETIRDGWLHTGDVGHLDDDGFLYITDRAKDMLIRGGENVYCVEIENRLVEHPGIADAAVVGVPHPELGEEVKAVIELAPGAALDDDEVRRWVGEALAAFKVPTYVERHEGKLPRNASGKLLKNVLRGEGHVSFAETM
ncbi:MAG: acyl--CoA ligase [Microthrixaceae bacterium]|nr:acyl--CoA ligase [Microthrixaceae bacterium]